MKNAILYAAIIFWGLTFIQRCMPLARNNIEFNFTNMTQLKYLLGLSYSAEEMEQALIQRKRFKRFIYDLDRSVNQ